MNFKELNQRMQANWEAAGKPICADCHEKVLGKYAMKAWVGNGHLCQSCAEAVIQVKAHAYLSIPPKGIR